MASPSLEEFSVPQNAVAVAGVAPEGHFFKQFRFNTGYLTDFLQCVPVIMLGKKIQNTVRILK